MCFTELHGNNDKRLPTEVTQCFHYSPPGLGACFPSHGQNNSHVDGEWVQQPLCVTRRLLQRRSTHSIIPPLVLRHVRSSIARGHSHISKLQLWCMFSTADLSFLHFYVSFICRRQFISAKNMLKFADYMTHYLFSPSAKEGVSKLQYFPWWPAADGKEVNCPEFYWQPCPLIPVICRQSLSQSRSRIAVLTRLSPATVEILSWRSRCRTRCLGTPADASAET